MRTQKALSVLVHEWVTGGGLAGLPLPPEWMETGRSIGRAIATDFANAPDPPTRVVMTIDARLPHDPGPWDFAPMAEGDGRDRLLELACASDVTILIAPETSGILASLTEDLERAGANHLGSTPEAVALAGNKVRVADYLRSLELATPATLKFDPLAGLPADARYPVVLKPLDGAGAQNTFLVADRQGLPPEALSMGAAVVQPFVPGAPMSASFLVDALGKAWLLAVGEQTIQIHDGRFEYLGGEMPVYSLGAQEQLTAAVDAIAGLRGFVGVDFVWSVAAECATIIEINPRPTMSVLGLTWLLPPGRLAGAWLAACDRGTMDPSLIGELTRLIRSRGHIKFTRNGELIPILRDKVTC